jgi:hypothetical protein
MDLRYLNCSSVHASDPSKYQHSFPQDPLLYSMRFLNALSVVTIPGMFASLPPPYEDDDQKASSGPNAELKASFGEGEDAHPPSYAEAVTSKVRDDVQAELRLVQATLKQTQRDLKTAEANARFISDRFDEVENQLYFAQRDLGRAERDAARAEREAARAEREAARAERSSALLRNAGAARRSRGIGVDSLPMSVMLPVRLLSASAGDQSASP